MLNYLFVSGFGICSIPFKAAKVEKVPVIHTKTGEKWTF